MPKLIFDKRELQAKTGVMLVLSFITLMVTNSVVVYLANLLFPTHVVLGTYALTPFWALLLSMGKFSLIGTAVMPLVAYREWKTKRDFSPKEWMLLYLFVNMATLWLITRFANIYGLGVSSWVVVIVLSAVLDWLQGLSMMALGKITIK